MKTSKVVMAALAHGAFVGATGDRTRLVEMRKALTGTQVRISTNATQTKAASQASPR